MFDNVNEIRIIQRSEIDERTGKETVIYKGKRRRTLSLYSFRDVKGLILFLIGYICGFSFDKYGNFWWSLLLAVLWAVLSLWGACSWLFVSKFTNFFIRLLIGGAIYLLIGFLYAGILTNFFYFRVPHCDIRFLFYKPDYDEMLTLLNKLICLDF